MYREVSPALCFDSRLPQSLSEQMLCVGAAATLQSSSRKAFWFVKDLRKKLKLMPDKTGKAAEYSHLVHSPGDFVCRRKILDNSRYGVLKHL